MTKQPTSVNVGIDVSKTQLDVHVLERNLAWSVANDEAGIRALVTRLRRYQLARVVVEATGRLEQPLVRQALARQLPIIVVSPLRIRRYAGAIGQLAKTDAIDARLIATFAAAVKPAVRAPIDPEATRIRDLIVRRRQLIEMRTMEKNRLTIMPADLAGSIQTLMTVLNSEIKELDRLLTRLCKVTPNGGSTASSSPACPASAIPSPTPCSVTCQNSVP